MPDKYRRKSLSIFDPPLSGLTPISEPTQLAQPAMLQKKRRKPPFYPGSPLSSGFSDGSSDATGSSPTSIRRVSSKSSMDRLIPRSRPRSLQKNGRPSSLFGSLRSLNSQHDGDDNDLTRTVSNASLQSAADDAFGSGILYHGEVQTAGGMFSLKKKNQYLVLTDTHLVRFKSKDRASDVFPVVPSSLGRASGNRHSRMSSSGSLHDLHTPASSESYYAMPLNGIVAVYRLDDGRPYFSIEIAHLDDATYHQSMITLHLHDPTECDLWMSSIRGAAMKARLTNPVPFSEKLTEYTARSIDAEDDYNPNHFSMFRVVQRATKSGASRSGSSDDLTKLTSSICILAVGVHMIHIIPLPRSSRTGSSSSLSEMLGASHGIAALTSLYFKDGDDSFSLSFRIPLCQEARLCLASSTVIDIALQIRQAADFLRPEWVFQPFTWNVPEAVHAQVTEMQPLQEDLQAFNRTLLAYCVAYRVDVSKIMYGVENVEDGPVFFLHPPPNGRKKYALLELLAVMRSLRYNESFGGISFNGISLDALLDTRDTFGSDHVPTTTRSGELLALPELINNTLMIHEIQGIAVNSKRLRRMDFSNCLSRRPLTAADKTSNEGYARHAKELGCGICEALFPLCAKQYTNVDWIILNGIVLDEIDIDYLFTAAIDRLCHFRAIELGFCGLNERTMTTILNALSHQFSTMEAIDLSGNPARLDALWHKQIQTFEFIRRIRLQRIARTSIREPLFPAEVLVLWKLEELCLDKTLLNTNTITALASYLGHPQSQYLRLLQLNMCELEGPDAATLLRASTQGRTQPRELRIEMSENRLELGQDDFIDAISSNATPTQLTLKMLEYGTESNFAAVLTAFSTNQTTKYLDISKVSMQNDAGSDTCEALHKLFEGNEALEYLDISGEDTKMVDYSLGKGINDALFGLKFNKSLKVLRIEHQKLGFRGASTLASVLEENTVLQELYCEDNQINLQAFTTLVNAVEINHSLQYLPPMQRDREWSERIVNKEVEGLRTNTNGSSLSMTSTANTAMASAKATVRRSLPRTMSMNKAPKIPERTSLLPDVDIRAAVSSLAHEWEAEALRLQGYLMRNVNLALGLPPEHMDDVGAPSLIDLDRPSTSESLATAIGAFSLDRTPTAELNHQIGNHVLDADQAGQSADKENERSMTEDEGDDSEDAPGLEMHTGARA